MSILLAIGDGSPAERDLWQSALRAALPGEEFIAQRDAATDADRIDVAIVANPAPGALAGLPKLRLIQSLWAGVERLLTDPSIPANVPIARLVDPAMGEAMAETALWAVLSLHRGFFAYAQRQREGLWQPHAQRCADEVTVTVLGLGAIGGRVARRLAANGYAVRGWSARPKTIDGIDCRYGDSAVLDSLLPSSEIVVNLLPLSQATRGLFDAARLARMPRDAALVNLGRGAQVVEADLLAALDSGHLRHAVLDVFETEPLPPQHRFWGHRQVTVLPHIAALTDPRSAAAIAARNVRALRDGSGVEQLVDRRRGY